MKFKLYFTHFDVNLIKNIYGVFMDTNALFKIGYGLYVLTANENGKDNGCIIHTVMQVT